MVNKNSKAEEQSKTLSAGIEHQRLMRRGCSCSTEAGHGKRSSKSQTQEEVRFGHLRTSEKAGTGGVELVAQPGCCLPIEGQSFWGMKKAAPGD